MGVAESRKNVKAAFHVEDVPIFVALANSKVSSLSQHLKTGRPLPCKETLSWSLVIVLTWLSDFKARDSYLSA